MLLRLILTHHHHNLRISHLSSPKPHSMQTQTIFAGIIRSASRN